MRNHHTWQWIINFLLLWFEFRCGSRIIKRSEYLKYVASGNMTAVEKLLSSADFDERSKNQKNCLEQNALRIAIENKNLKMCDLLLRNNVRANLACFWSVAVFVISVDAVIRCWLHINLFKKYLFQKTYGWKKNQRRLKQHYVQNCAWVVDYRGVQLQALNLANKIFFRKECRLLYLFWKS